MTEYFSNEKNMLEEKINYYLNKAFEFVLRETQTLEKRNNKDIFLKSKSHGKRSLWLRG